MLQRHLLTLSLLAFLCSCSEQTLKRQPQSRAQSGPAIELAGLRPEMLDWWWDNLNAADAQIHPGEQGFSWLQPPHSPQHLGYSAGATYRSTLKLDGASYQLLTRYLAPAELAEPIEVPHFLAARIEIEGHGLLTLIHEYQASGERGRDTALRIRLLPSPDLSPALRAGLRRHVEDKLRQLPNFLPALFQTDFIEAELHARGYFTHGIQADGSYLLEVTQVIERLNPEMLNWWWDHIGSSARYRRWHPTAHVSFEWLRPPQQADHRYDIGASQRVIEYIGDEALVLDITGADPVEVAHIVRHPQQLFYATTELAGTYIEASDQPLITPVVPPQSSWLLHEWADNPEGPGIVLSSRFSLPLFVAATTMPDDLGWHALEEFQFLSYALPDWYAAEADQAKRN